MRSGGHVCEWKGLVVERFGRIEGEKCMRGWREGVSCRRCNPGKLCLQNSPCHCLPGCKISNLSTINRSTERTDA